MHAVLTLCGLLALLAVAVGASGSWGLPTIVTKWSVPIPSGAQVALVAQDVILFSSQAPANGGQYNSTIQAVTAANGTLWAASSIGPTQSPTQAFGFPAIPQVVFIAANNLQPPNVSAVIPSTGRVVWSRATAFDAAKGGSLVASVDGASIYFSAPESGSGGKTQVTAIDSLSGDLLFASQFPALYIPAECGATGDSCLVSAHGSEVWLLDGRTGYPLGGVSLQTHTPVRDFTVIAPNLVMAATLNELFMVNTTDYTVAWSKAIQMGTVRQLQKLPTGSSTAAVLVLADAKGLSALDAATGNALWHSTAASLCPNSGPFPGDATSLEGLQSRLGEMPAGETEFLYAVVCFYGNQTLDVFGRINATDGTVTSTRYLSWFPASAPVPIGSSYFMLLYSDHRTNQTTQYFLTSHPWVFGVYPPWSFGCTPSDFILPTVRASDVVFTLNCDETLVTAVTIVA